MKAKEIARLMTNGLKAIKADIIDEEGNPSNEQIGTLENQEDKNEFDRRIYEAGVILFEECVHLINNMKRPVNSAVKEINIKSDSITALVNKYFGYKVLNTAMFTISIACQNEEEDRKAILIEKAGSKKLYDQIYRAISRTKEYRKLIETAQYEEQRQKAMENLVPYAVTPLEKLAEDNSLITGELLNRFAAIGGYHRAGIPITWMRPLIEETKFIQEANRLRENGLLDFDMDLVLKYKENPKEAMKLISLRGR